ncbi:MAG: hypothetical protein KY446_10530 [Proteobacteria bacterium]|nr:hypothetical protein [Pseudomonadota bacterium]
MKPARSAAFAAAVALSPLVVAPGASAAPPPKVHTVMIDDMAFGRLPANVRRGDVVVWVNQDIFRHTATARDKSFDVDLPPGKSARTVVRKPGAISFYCRYHPGMTGRLVVAS